MRRAAGFLVCICLTVLPVTAPAVDIDGFVKNFFLIQRLPHYDAAPGATAPDPATFIADLLSTRVNVQGNPADWAGVEAAYSLIPRYMNDDFARVFAASSATPSNIYRIDDPDPILYPSSIDSTDNFVVTGNLDRLYVAFAASKFDFILGRQAVAWGSAKALNPTDVIAPFLFTEIDMEYRIGVDAARLRVPVGDLGEIDAGYVAGEDVEFDNSAAYVRAKQYLWNMDVAVTGMLFRQQAMLGLDFTRGIGGFGTWVEGAYVWVSDEARAASPVSGTEYDDEWWARLSAGADYSLGNGTYLFCEYHFNSPGSTDPHDYRFQILTPAYADGNVYLFGKHYLIPGVGWPITPLWNANASALWNLPDGSVLLNAIVEYNWKENIYLDLAAFVGFGANPIYDPQGANLPIVAPGITIDPLATEFRSEFGAYPDTYYFTIRYYF